MRSIVATPEAGNATQRDCGATPARGRGRPWCRRPSSRPRQRASRQSRAALEHYRATLAADALRDLQRGSDARSAIRSMMIERIVIAAGDGGRGCLAVNAACERLPHDAATRSIVRDMQDAGRQAMADVLRAAQQHGELARRHDTDALAAFLTTFLNGLLVSAKISPDVRALEPLVDVALTALDHDPSGG